MEPGTFNSLARAIVALALAASTAVLIVYQISGNIDTALLFGAVVIVAAPSLRHTRMPMWLGREQSARPRWRAVRSRLESLVSGNRSALHALSDDFECVAKTATDQLLLLLAGIVVWRVPRLALLIARLVRASEVESQAFGDRTKDVTSDAMARHQTTGIEENLV